MYFDFEDYRPDIETVGSAISRREGIMLSIAVHAIFIAVLVFLPEFPGSRAAAERAAKYAELQRQLQLQRERESRRFVFVQPRVDIEALKPPVLGEDSDKNRMARAPEKAKDARNPMPFARGNSSERVEAADRARARGQGPAEEPTAGARDGRGATTEGNSSGGNTLPNVARGPSPQAPPGNREGANGRSPVQGGALGEALRNLQRYVQHDAFDNPQGGGGAWGPSIQFDTKGVEFGPWIRRFVAQIKRNWFIPYAAMAMKGHVVITFYVHKDGTISDLAIVGPSSIDAFNNSAFNALVASSPTQPLPPEYPADRAFFTVTFYYNETPPAQ